MAIHILAFDCTAKAERSILGIMARYNCDHAAAMRFALDTGLQILEQVNDVTGVGFISKASGEVLHPISLVNAPS